MSAIVVYVKYGDLPIWSFELDGCNVVGAGYVDRVPVVGVQFAVYPYTDLTICSLPILLIGNIDLKFVGVLILLKLVKCGSCISIMSYFWLTLSFMISMCALADLLRFI